MIKTPDNKVRCYSSCLNQVFFTEGFGYDKLNRLTASTTSESILYDTFNKPTRIAGASITDFYYGPDHELYKEVSGTKTTYKLAGGMYEVIVDGVILNNRVPTTGTQSANDTVFLHTDHLGSVEATTNALGQFVNRMSFGAWGERKNRIGNRAISPRVSQRQMDLPVTISSIITT